uniref:FISNA domain-containing protein n=1 Tax=Xiphophorus couchianus TaxID=32473 RepID=A0A3B5L152_9TELE
MFWSCLLHSAINAQRDSQNDGASLLKHLLLCKKDIFSSIHLCFCLSPDFGLQEDLDKHRNQLKRRCKHVTEGADELGARTLLNSIYTELYITEGQREEVNTQHEVKQLETASKALSDTSIRCHDIFKAFPDQQGAIRVVLTNGVAGVGKTFSVQKLVGCRLSETHCEVVASALMSSRSQLIELDLTGNVLPGPGVKLLCDGLFELSELLEAAGCQKSAVIVWSSLMSNPSHLKHLDMGLNNKLQDSGMKLLCAFLENSESRLKTLRLLECSLTGIACAYLASALKSNPSPLTYLDMSGNNLQDSGVKHLCAFMETPNCKLQKLRKKMWDFTGSKKSHIKMLPPPCLIVGTVMLGVTMCQKTKCVLLFISLWGCRLSGTSCASIVSALNTNPSFLKRLELRDNNLQDSDVEQLLDLVESPQFRLQRLRSARASFCLHIK